MIHKPSLGSREVQHKNLGPIGSAVLMFIGYKQTDRQTKQNLYIEDRYLYIEDRYLYIEDRYLYRR